MINTLKRMRGEEQGFTLIELLVVILIIAILVLVGLPAFLGQQEKAKKSGAQQKLRTAYSAAKSAAVFNDGKYPTDLADAIVSEEPGLAGDISSGKLTIGGVANYGFTAEYEWDTGKKVEMTVTQGGVAFSGL